MMCNNKFFSTSISLYDGKKWYDSIIIIVDTIFISLFQNTAGKFYSAFDLNYVESLILSETVPSFGAFELESDTANRLQTSHIIFDCDSVGLIIKYIQEMRQYGHLDSKIGLKVTDNTLDYIIKATEKKYCSLPGLMREKLGKELENDTGTVRSSIEGKVFIRTVTSTNFFGSDVFSWVEWFFVLTNVGLLQFSVEKGKEDWPKLIPLSVIYVEKAKANYKQ
jgi:hypothetical protein